VLGHRVRGPAYDSDTSYDSVLDAQEAALGPGNKSGDNESRADEAKSGVARGTETAAAAALRPALAGGASSCGDMTSSDEGGGDGLEDWNVVAVKRRVAGAKASAGVSASSVAGAGHPAGWQVPQGGQAFKDRVRVSGELLREHRRIVSVARRRHWLGARNDRYGSAGAEAADPGEGLSAGPRRRGIAMNEQAGESGGSAMEIGGAEDINVDTGGHGRLPACEVCRRSESFSDDPILVCGGAGCGLAVH